MRKLGPTFIWLIGCYSSLPAGFTLEGQTFPATNVDIVWKAPTNALPQRIWVYKCVAQEFSPKVVSHLMALGNFTEKIRPAFRASDPSGRSASATLLTLHVRGI